MLALVDGKMVMFAWIEAVIGWLKDADNRGVVTVLVSTMALLLSVVTYIWPRRPKEIADKEGESKPNIARRGRPLTSKPLSGNITVMRGLAVALGVLATLGIAYGIYKAVSLGRDEVAVHYTACLGEYERNCGFAHDVYLYCYADVPAYFKDKCLRVTASAIGSHDGNKCGYTNVSVLCTQKKP